MATYNVNYSLHFSPNADPEIHTFKIGNIRVRNLDADEGTVKQCPGDGAIQIEFLAACNVGAEITIKCSLTELILVRIEKDGRAIFNETGNTKKINDIKRKANSNGVISISGFFKIV